MNTLREVPHPDPIQLAIEVLSASFDLPGADEAIAGLALLREQAPQQSGVGNSGFESWYNSYSPAHKSDKQRACDAYAAGMGDPLVATAPAAVAGPSEAEVRKQDTELIRQLVEALTTLRATGSHEGFAHDIATTAITAGRARLEGKP